MTILTVTCAHCNSEIAVSLKKFNKSKKKGNKNFYCSSECRSDDMRKYPKVECAQCSSIFQARYDKIKFCSQSCAATYNNTHKTKGARVSKLENYLKEQLISLYDFEIKFNSKQEIHSELDIYIPSLSLAFELNGIFHYEPIYGSAKLKAIRKNDHTKRQLCKQHFIELHIIDTRSQKYFKESSSKKFLDTITETISKKLSILNSTQNAPREGTS